MTAKKIIAGLVLLLAASLVGAAPTVTLTATPTTGISPVSVVLTWSSTGATSCTASGGWTGTKGLSGTQTLAGITASQTYVLTCVEGAGQAVLTWVAPTKNTDGSNLTNLAGFRVYYATTAAGVPVATAVQIPNPATKTYTVTGLAAGTWYFGAKAYSTAGIESDMSAIPNKVIVLAAASANATVTVDTKPEAPVVTIAQTVKLLLNNKPSLVAGNVPLGTECGPFEQGQWARVPRDDVKLNFWGRVFRNSTLVARCA